MKATRLEKCQSLEHILLFHNDIVQNHDISKVTELATG